MKVRTAEATDRERILTSFRPMFGSWDYLPLVVDSLLVQSSASVTLVAEDGDLVLMTHAYETDPGDWFLRGLRSNPAVGSFRVGVAIRACIRAMHTELNARGGKRVRYGTLDSFSESLRLSSILGFREQFRLWHSSHPLPDEVTGPGPHVGEADFSNEFLSLFLSGSSIAEDEYYFTWWDTRRLDASVLKQASAAGLLLEATTDGIRSGAALLYHVDWQDMLVLSLVEGDDSSIKSLCIAAFGKGRSFGCRSIGIVHPSKAEALRRQKLLGLEDNGTFTIQLTRDV
jgi:hypothetical protein